MHTQWLITYGAGCPSITMLPGLDADEIYTAQWRESKYTLVHLQRRACRAQLQESLAGHVILREILGFDAIACDDLESHPGYKHIVKKAKGIGMGEAPLEVWMATGSLSTNPKGLLWKHIDHADPAKMTRAELIRRHRERGLEIVRLRHELRMLKPSHPDAQPQCVQQ